MSKVVVNIVVELSDPYDSAWEQARNIADAAQALTSENDVYSCSVSLEEGNVSTNFAAAEEYVRDRYGRVKAGEYILPRPRKSDERDNSRQS